MVAIKSRDAERFVKAPPDSVFLFLLHGADAGLVRERALAIVAQRVDDRHDPFQCVEMSGDAVAADPLSLLDEANTIPLFGGRRAIIVETGGKSILSPLEQLLAAPPVDCAVVLTAGALKQRRAAAQADRAVEARRRDRMQSRRRAGSSRADRSEPE